jgi:hypothetical protein
LRVSGCTEEWTYRYLAAAYIWAQTEDAALARIGLIAEDPNHADGDVRCCGHAIDVPDRGHLLPKNLAGLETSTPDHTVISATVSPVNVIIVLRRSLESAL